MLISIPWRVVLMTMVRDALFYVPVAIMYFGTKGADVGGFFVLQALYRVATMVFEVPTGYLSDRWTRTRQMTMANILWVVAILVLIFGQTYTFIVISYLIAALADSFYSGTVESYMHESLKKEGREAEAPMWQGRIFAGTVGMEVVAGAIGGWLYTQNIDWPMWATFICACGSILIALSLPAIPHVVERRHAHPLIDLGLVVRWCLRDHPRLPWLLLSLPIIFGCTGVLFWAQQHRLNVLNLSPVWLGYAMSGYMLAKVIAAALMGRVLARLGERASLALVIVFFIVGLPLLALAQTPLLAWAGAVLSAGLTHGLGKPLLTSLVNHNVGDGERATVLSVASMVGMASGASLMFAVKPLYDAIGFQNTLLLYLVGTVVLISYPVYRLMRDNGTSTSA